MVEQNVVQTPLARQLKAIMVEAKVNIEVQNFTNKLVEAARQGLGKLHFTDLRDEIPTMIMNETAWAWFKDNELAVSGTIDQSTGAYNYTISWE